MPRRNTAAGNGNRSMWNNVGKGDSDRSPRWREHYHEIAWPDGGRRRLIDGDGFEEKGSKLVKHYGVREPEKNTI